MLAKLEQAKANNETLKVSYTTVLFSGSSGVGKTTLLNKLNKENLNIHHHSTGVAKSKHSICIKTSLITQSTEGLQWTNLDYDTMINYLNKHLYNLKFPSLSLTTSSSPPKEIMPSDLDNTMHTSMMNSITDSSPKYISLSTAREESAIKRNKEIKVDTIKEDLVAVDIAKADSSKTPSLGDVWDIVNFLDTGGQPEFVNILPAVSSSIALTFIVFNLSKNLDSLVHVQHSINGELSFKPYYLDCTNLEFIKQLIVSSENININSTPLLQLKSVQRKETENNPKICYVGTHAHAQNVREETIQEIDDQLSSAASELKLHQRSFWASPKEELKRLFPIEMFPGENEEECESVIGTIRENILKQVQKRDYYEIPITWFIFLLKLQKLCNESKVTRSYISYHKAVSVWVDEKVSGKGLRTELDQEQVHSDVKNILIFFHFMGMLLYYHKVEGLCDFVFIDCQWLFEKLTELVEIKFTKCYNRMDISAEDFERFTKEGRLSINIIKNLKIDLQGIQPLYFIHLLDHLKIIAPIDSKLKDYFMPCVLPSFPPKNSANKFSELDKNYGAIQHVPLLVGFTNGPVHHGYFCHLIVELFRNLPTDWYSPLLSTTKLQHVYNNLVTFPTCSGHSVSIFYKIGYLEIQVRHEKAQSTIIHSNVRHELDKALRKVSAYLQLNKEKFCYGFYCKCEKIQHFVKLKELTPTTKYISCGYSNNELTDEHRAWLEVELYIIVYCVAI